MGAVLVLEAEGLVWGAYEWIVCRLVDVMSWSCTALRCLRSASFLSRCRSFIRRLTSASPLSMGSTSSSSDTWCVVGSWYADLDGWWCCCGCSCGAVMGCCWLFEMDCGTRTDDGDRLLSG